MNEKITTNWNIQLEYDIRRAAGEHPFRSYIAIMFDRRVIKWRSVEKQENGEKFIDLISEYFLKENGQEYTVDDICLWTPFIPIYEMSDCQFCEKYNICNRKACLGMVGDLVVYRKREEL